MSNARELSLRPRVSKIWRKDNGHLQCRLFMYSVLEIDGHSKIAVTVYVVLRVCARGVYVPARATHHPSRRSLDSNGKHEFDMAGQKIYSERLAMTKFWDGRTQTSTIRSNQICGAYRTGQCRMGMKCKLLHICKGLELLAEDRTKYEADFVEILIRSLHRSRPEVFHDRGNRFFK
jgi:hypothetical protein